MVWRRKERRKRRLPQTAASSLPPRRASQLRGSGRQQQQRRQQQHGRIPAPLTSAGGGGEAADGAGRGSGKGGRIFPSRSPLRAAGSRGGGAGVCPPSRRWSGGRLEPGGGFAGCGDPATAQRGADIKAFKTPHSHCWEIWRCPPTTAWRPPVVPPLLCGEVSSSPCPGRKERKLNKKIKCREEDGAESGAGSRRAGSTGARRRAAARPRREGAAAAAEQRSPALPPRPRRPLCRGWEAKPGLGQANKAVTPARCGVLCRPLPLCGSEAVLG